MKVKRTLPAKAATQVPEPDLSPGSMLGRLRQMAKGKANSDADADIVVQDFRQEDRAAVRSFISVGSAQRDVAQQFPLLAYLIATRRVPPRQRRAAQCAIAAGQPLSRIARLAEVPMWTRVIPAASCIDPRGPLPQSADFTCRISDILRRRLDGDADLRGLLRLIAQANTVGGEELALWLASRHPEGHLGEDLTIPLRLIALWYLFTKVEHGLGRSLILTRWSRDLSLETGVRAVRNFARRIDIELLVGPQGLGDPWFPSTTFMDLDFIPMLTSTQVRDEALSNQNCLDWYAQRLAGNEARIFSVRDRHGRCIANVEISGSEKFPSIPRIAQIKAPRNEAAEPYVASIAETWLRRQIRAHGAPDMRRRKLPAPDARRWQEIVAPLKTAGTLPQWAEQCPTGEDLSKFDLELSVLGYRLHARGWRFA